MQDAWSTILPGSGDGAASLANYDLALTEPTLPDDLAKVLTGQKKRIEAELDNLRELRTQFIGTRDRAATE